MCSLGYSLGSSYNHVLKAFSYAGYVLAVLAVIAVVVVFCTACASTASNATWGRPSRTCDPRAADGRATARDAGDRVRRNPLATVDA